MHFNPQIVPWHFPFFKAFSHTNLIHDFILGSLDRLGSHTLWKEKHWIWSRRTLWITAPPLLSWKPLSTFLMLSESTLQKEMITRNFQICHKDLINDRCQIEWHTVRTQKILTMTKTTTKKGKTINMVFPILQANITRLLKVSFHSWDLPVDYG